ncbi:MAG: DNA-processing protein DprA [Patescibacteria group bacterium]|nr:DNA-processing protein DprA [Patescibacteria group bacterium]
MKIKNAEENIRTVDINSVEYPKALKKISNPPKILYIKGTFQPEKNLFAIVGTRMFSSYGKEVCLEIAGNLARAGLTIVSGLAPGIDTWAHQATLEQKATTIAVLGTGIDKKSIYPQENVILSKKIIENNGCLISEYPPGTRGTRFSFPQRNRIISGLSIGTLVIEAKQKSGALITANYARKAKRKIFAVPGSIYSPNSKGCHYLIKQGAKLIESADDILKELNIEPIKNNLKNEINGETLEENLILGALKQGNLYIDKIIEQTKLNTPTIVRGLAILEIKNKIRNLGNNIYALNK